MTLATILRIHELKDALETLKRESRQEMASLKQRIKSLEKAK